MNNQFTQPKNGVSKETNKEAIARVYSVKKSDVTYLEVDGPVTGYSVLYDKVTQSCWVNVVSGSFVATGSAVSWAIAAKVMTLVTTTGTYTLDQLIPVNTLGLDRFVIDDAKVNVKQPLTDSVTTTQHEVNSRFLSPLDAGAKGDGTTLDSAAFALYEVWRTGKDVDLHGKSYVVTTVPVGNRYFNGKFIVGGVTKDANYILARMVNGVITALGDSAKSVPSDYSLPLINRFSYRNGSFFAGGAATKITASGQSVGIGGDALGNTLISFDNIGIGEASLQNVQSPLDAYSSDATGSRNVAIGGNTLQFTTTGWNNIAVGRNAGVCAVNTVGMVAIGNGAFGGIGENGWYDYIENFCPNTSGQVYSVALGQAAGAVYQGIQLTTVGGDSGKAMKKGVGNSLFGRQSGSLLESLLGLNGKQLTTLNAAATYVKTDANLVITLAGSGAVVGGYAAILPTTGPADVTHNHVFPCLITAVSGDTFTVQCPYIGNGSGNVTVGWTVNTTDGAMSQANAAFGDHSIMRATSANDTSALGNRAGQNTVTLLRSTLVGARAGQNAPSITDTALFGSDSGNNATTFVKCTGLGGYSLRVLIDGTIATTLTNSSAIGYDSRVSGDNQIQLGSSTQAPYAYSALQLRSDARDKTEVRDTDLGIEFINGLRPVRGKWNMRDDYYVEQEDGTFIFDGKAYLAKTKMRTREHDWFIAQEIEQLCNKLGVDFAGLHHAQVNGGCDVYSLGYTDFIPPMTKAIQQCWSRMDELEARLADLESK